MSTNKYLAANLGFLVFLLIQMFPIWMGEGQYGHGEFAVPIFCVSLLLTLTSPLNNEESRRTVFLFRCLLGVLAAIFVWRIAVIISADGAAMARDARKFFLGAFLMVLMLVAQIAFNHRGLRVLVLGRGHGDNRGGRW